MLSSLVVGRQKRILIKDELGTERASEKFVTQLLKEQGEDATIKVLPVGTSLGYVNTLENFVSDCNDKPEQEGTLWNIILPTLSDFMAYQKESIIFAFLHELTKCQYVQRIFLWTSIHNIQHNHVDYIVASCEHMSDLVLHILSTNELSLLICEPDGVATFKRYTYTKTRSEFKVELCRNVKEEDAPNIESEDKQKSEQPSTSRKNVGIMTTKIPIKFNSERLARLYRMLDEEM